MQGAYPQPGEEAYENTTPEMYEPEGELAATNG
jgi:hypothetical protein